LENTRFLGVSGVIQLKKTSQMIVSMVPLMRSTIYNGQGRKTV